MGSGRHHTVLWGERGKTNAGRTVCFFDIWPFMKSVLMRLGIPEVGFSTHVGSHVFETTCEAIEERMSCNNELYVSLEDV
jgi:hypothetical protein